MSGRDRDSDPHTVEAGGEAPLPPPTAAEQWARVALTLAPFLLAALVWVILRLI